MGVPTNNDDVSGKAEEMDENYWYIDGIAYDFTDFVKKHPGGEYALYLGQGRECKPLIWSYHLEIEKVEKYFKTYRLPSNHPSQLQNVAEMKFEPINKFSWNEDGFYATVKREAVKHFKENNLSPKAGFWGFFSFFFSVMTMFLSMYVMCTQTVYTNYIAALVHGVFRAVIVVQSTHGGSHFAYSYNPMVNRWIYRVGTILIGLWNPKVWDIQHVVAHHNYTNEWPYDTDSGFPIKSITYNQKRFGYHKYQHIYIWLVYAFTIPLVLLNSVKDTIIGRQVLFKLNYQVIGARLEVWACTFLSIFYLLIPFFFLSFKSAFFISMVSNITSSLYFSLQFVVNHEVDDIFANGPVDGVVDWGEYQVNESTSFAPHSRLSLYMAGGLNTQIEHHLFPGVYFGHYEALHKITRNVCKDFGIHYNERPTLMQALKGHYELLKNPPQSLRTGKDSARKKKNSKKQN